jgi:hypothetical protein
LNKSEFHVKMMIGRRKEMRGLAYEREKAMAEWKRYVPMLNNTTKNQTAWAGEPTHPTAIGCLHYLKWRNKK